MKRFAIAIFTLVLVASPMCQAAALSDRKTDKEQERSELREKVAQALEARDYKVEMDYAQGMRGRQVSLTSGYVLEVDGDKAEANLPFYGRAYNLPYGEGGGIRFDDAVLADYESTWSEKKLQTEISFRVSASGDVFLFNLTVFPDGNVSCSVSSNNRQPMSYRGQIILVDDRSGNDADKDNRKH